MKQLHKQYTAGVSSQDALRYVHQLNRQGYRALLNCLGERTDSPSAAKKKTNLYRNLLQAIYDRQLDASISVKLSDLGIRQSVSLANKNLEVLLTIAKETNRIVEIDMEYRSLVQPTVDIALQMLQRGFQFRLAIQSGLQSALPYATQLLTMARRSTGNIGFRIVTGSCYSCSQDGYQTTLETSEAQTIAQFYMLLDLAMRWRRKGGLCSAIGSRNLDRIVYASLHGFEIQLLKGEEQTKAFLVADELREERHTRLAFYVGFGSLEDDGVKAYLLRRIQ